VDEDAAADGGEVRLGVQGADGAGQGVGAFELGVVVEREDDPAGPERVARFRPPATPQLRSRRTSVASGAPSTAALRMARFSGSLPWSAIHTCLDTPVCARAEATASTVSRARSSARMMTSAS
jgi:hypothetical protein